MSTTEIHYDREKMIAYVTVVLEHGGVVKQEFPIRSTESEALMDVHIMGTGFYLRQDDKIARMHA